MQLTLEKVEFDEQRTVVEKVLQVLPVSRFLIDRNGLGMDLAEKVCAKYPQAEGIDFTNSSKELMAIELKLRFQRGEVPIPLERDLMYQIHSIRKRVTDAKNSVYDTENNEKHHADMFWALALCVWAGRNESGPAVTFGNNLFSGWRG